MRRKLMPNKTKETKKDEYIVIYKTSFNILRFKTFASEEQLKEFIKDSSDEIVLVGEFKKLKVDKIVILT